MVYGGAIRAVKVGLGYSVYLDNESMCSASCENWLGLCKDVEDFICINIESGIGSGLFLREKHIVAFQVVLARLDIYPLMRVALYVNAVMLDVLRPLLLLMVWWQSQ